MELPQLPCPQGHGDAFDPDIMDFRLTTLGLSSFQACCYSRLECYCLAQSQC